MKLVLLKISGDGDYGALTFEQSGESLQECYDQMIEEGVQAIEGGDDDDNPDWQVTIEETIEVRDKEEADKILRAITAVAADDWLGDYDRQKSTNWSHLII